jgi:hypothetical protein
VRKLSVAILVSALVAGCTSAATPAASDRPGVLAPTDRPASTAPWPGEWLSGVCHGQLHLNQAFGHLVELEESLEAFDYDSGRLEATSVARNATQALDRLKAVPAWMPGRSLVIYLVSEATALRKVANLAKLMLDGKQSALKDLEAQVRVYTRARDRGATSQRILADKYDFDC